MAVRAIGEYLQEVQSKLAMGVATEHAYRAALEWMLRKLAPTLRVLNEPKRIKAGQPDFVVKQETGFGLVDVGHVEAKDIGLLEPRIERTDQMKRYLAELPNLILTDYLEFRHYVGGKLRETARLASVGPDGRLVRDAEGEDAVERMLLYFLKTKPQEITSAEDLAKRMAFLTRYIRDAICKDYEAGAPSPKVSEWRRRLAKDLITDLEQPQKTEEFADMFAQTLAYGLFSARTMDRTPESFTRGEAQDLIPATNPFLRDFFYEITGPTLKDETFAPFVEDLVSLLAYTKMDMVLEDFGKGRQGHDPVIHFYETFLAAYDPKMREARGVYYTPEPVVQYIVRSVDWLLKTRFGLEDGLGSREKFRDENRDPNLRLQGDRAGGRKTVMRHRVQVLDPACGTGTFLFAMVNLIRERMMARGDAGEWSDYVREDLLPRMFGFELLMAPYAVAHFKLGLQLAGGDLPEELRDKWRYDFSSNERLNVFLTNTLEAAHPEGTIPMFDVVGRESIEADAVKRDLPILVVMGNPPYSGHSSNKGEWIKGLLRGKDGAKDTVNYFEVDGKPLGERNPKWLNDDYVKFMRFAQWRIDRTEQGILAFISNNGYLDNPTFRGMRQALMETFTDIYILDLHGSSKKKEVAPDGSKDENVFDIQQGVAIGIFVKEAGKQGPARVHHADLWGLREHKYEWLLGHDLGERSPDKTMFSDVEPQAPFYLFVPQDGDVRTEYYSYWGLTDICQVSNAGIVTARDSLTIHWNEDAIWQTVNDFVALPPEVARMKYNLGDDARDWKVELAQKDLRVSGLSMSNLIPLLYRPFDIRYTYYTGASRGFHCMPRGETMRHMLKGANLALITTRQTRDKWDVLATNLVIGHKAVAAYDINSIFPLYLYPHNKQASFGDGIGVGQRRANLNPAFVSEMEEKLGLRYVGDGKGDLAATFGPEDVFDYMYAVFHSPTYRERYAEFLKIDFPRVPITSDAGLFRTLSGLGARLVGRHLMEDDGQRTTDDSESLAVSYPVRGTNEVEQVRWADGRVWLNKEQYFEGVPQEVWDFHIGGYRVAEKWLKDRKGRVLTADDREHYRGIVSALWATGLLMKQIDAAIGEWPIG